jgi:2-hydroxyacyl-CoA lyase 1
MPDDLIRRLAVLPAAKRALLEAEVSRTTLDGPALVARALAAAGVTHVYGVPGEPVYDVFAACAASGLRLIGARSQQGAVAMAASHNYFAGRQAAAVLVSSGAAACNAVAAALHARDNCWPLVILAGAAARGASKRGDFMYVDTARVFEPVRFGVRGETAARYFHRAATLAPDPKIAIVILGDRSNAGVAKSVLASVIYEVAAIR